MYIPFNPNPRRTRRGQPRRVGDCVIRAVARANNLTWEEAYCLICAQGFRDGDMPSSDAVWGAYLQSVGFRRAKLPDFCPECYSVAEFAEDNPDGIFVLGTGKHAVAVVDGDWYDTWDSGDEVPNFAWGRG